MPTKLNRFKNDTYGTMTLEAVILFPLMFWLLIFGPITFDIVRERTAVVRNTYMVAKAISLEDEELTPTVYAKYRSIYNELFPSGSNTGIRIAEVQKDGAGVISVLCEDPNAVGFSRTLTDKIAEVQDIFPYFSNSESMFIVEGWREYSSIVQWKIGDVTLGWKDEIIAHRVFVRPRAEDKTGCV